MCQCVCQTGNHRKKGTFDEDEAEVEVSEDSIPTTHIQDLLQKCEDVHSMVLRLHPDQDKVARAGDLYNNAAILYFKDLLKQRMKQTTMDQYLTKHSN